MDLLNKISNYWYECIKKEDILKNNISLNVPTKSILCPFKCDYFIFTKKDNRIKITDERIIEFSRHNVLEKEFYYGYPLIFYREKTSDGIKDFVAPLFVIKVKFEREGLNIFLLKEEPYPICGIQALTKLGLKEEEISNINQSMEELFMNDVNIAEGDIVKKSLDIIEKEVDVSKNELINPSQLTNDEKLTHHSTAGLYNKSLIFESESTAFNATLLQDLSELKKRTDLEKTALSFFAPQVEQSKNDLTKNIIPILPFPSNEYQVAAMEDVFKQSLSVIKGPPGTGKSQFISNLIITLFWAGKTVLFVSHTNEAVEVVNQKINEQFLNLMLRTGRKEISQQLVEKFNELLSEHLRINRKLSSEEYVHSSWRNLLETKKSLLKRDELENEYQRIYVIQNELRASLQIPCSLFRKIKININLLFLKYKSNKCLSILKKYPEEIMLERKIKELEKKYYENCRNLIANAYLNKMVGNGKNTGAVNVFLDRVKNYRFRENESRDNHFLNALNVLKVWSCTLKSLRRTFPLKAGVFDYVIFDEASQIDLPSAAPALYRAKKAIVVGDPMQLTHIAGITKTMDLALAKEQGLVDMKDIYPDKVRYCDVSLYKAAENSLDHLPILLTKHYRSEDQIISLCNKAFYNEQLKIFSSLDYGEFPAELPRGVEWVDVRGEVKRTSAGSRENQLEADKVFEIFKDIWRKIENKKISIGVVTPYNSQNDLIHQKIRGFLPDDISEKRVRILTAHKFQGSEADIIIFSVVISARGNGNSDKWYDIYPQILNVALSRARYLLYIIGDKNYCEKRNGVLKKIINAYKTIKSEEELENNILNARFDTPSEKKIYEAAQTIGLEDLGYRLVPKKVVKRYTLDFALIGRRKIAIEIDGGQHEIIKGLPVIEDVERDEFLKKEGWETLRFSNYRVLSEMPEVINELKAALS